MANNGTGSLNPRQFDVHFRTTKYPTTEARKPPTIPNKQVLENTFTTGVGIGPSAQSYNQAILGANAAPKASPTVNERYPTLDQGGQPSATA